MTQVRPERTMKQFKILLGFGQDLKHILRCQKGTKHLALRLLSLYTGGEMSPKPLLFLALNFISGAIALAQSVPAGARITDVTLQGSGCDMAEASVVLSPDLKDLSLFFDNYVVEIGEGSQNPHLLKLTKECRIQVQLQIPDGWQMAFKGSDYRGFVALSSQGTGFHRFSILQEGAQIVSMREAFLKGPLNQDYHVRSEVKTERLTWSPCLRGATSINLISQLGVALNPRNSDRSLTQMALDSNDTSFKQSLSVEWKRCSFSRPDHPREQQPGPIRPGPRPRNPVRPPQFR